MSTYLELVNKTLQESSKEQNDLTLATWNSAEAGRRLYPRVKRMVAEAWKMIQMSRFEWEFKSAELFRPIYPRLKVQDGDGDIPLPGTRFRGAESGFEFTVKQLVLPKGGDWATGDWEGQIEIEQDYTGTTPVPAELFEETLTGASVCQYVQKGSYDFTEFDPLLREIQWETFVANQLKNTPVPVLNVPWNNWLYKDLSFTQGSRTVPQYLSQDFEGNIVFYPQTLDPFFISCVYTRSPQTLSDPEDVPLILKEEYHDWIAWQAVLNLALYDKDKNLQAYAMPYVRFYENRAMRELLPQIEWGTSQFDG